MFKNIINLKSLMRIGILFVAFCLLIASFIVPPKAYAGYSYVSVSSTAPYIGDQFAVTVSFDGSNYQGLEGVLTYDSSILEFTGSDGSGTPTSYGGSGEIRYALMQASGTMYMNFYFNVIGPGSCTISAISNLIYTSDGQQLSDSSSATFTASRRPDPTPTPSETTSQTQTTTETETLSSDTSLSSLDISAGELVPEFSSDVYEYTVYAGEEATKCTLSAVATSSTSSVSISGEADLIDELTSRIITVTAEDGSQANYTINIVKSDKPIYGATVIIDDIEYESFQNLSETLAPSGFTLSKASYGDEEISVFKNKDNTIVITQLHLKDSDTVGWFLFNSEENPAFTPIEVIDLDGVKYAVFASNLNRIYGIQGDKEGYFVYDPNTEEFIFIESDLDKSSEQEKTDENTEVSSAPIQDNLKIYLIIALVTIVLFFVVQLFIYRKFLRKNKK